MDPCHSTSPLPDPAPGEMVVMNLLYRLREVAKEFWARKWHGIFYFGELSLVAVCEEWIWDKQDRSKGHEISPRRRGKKGKEGAEQSEVRRDAVPQKGSQNKDAQIVEREPEKCNVRKAQGTRECTQSGLNHLRMERKLIPLEKFRTIISVPPGQTKWRVTSHVPALHKF